MSRQLRLPNPMPMLFAAALAAFALSVPVRAQEPIEQIQLTEKQIQNYLAAQKDISALAEKMRGDKPGTEAEKQMNEIVKKAGFASFDEYLTVADNISLVMSGIDPKTKEFSEPKAAIQKEIDNVKADTSIPAEEKKEALEELQQALQSAAPVKYPGNVDLVKKYYDQIDQAM